MVIQNLGKVIEKNVHFFPFLKKEKKMFLKKTMCIIGGICDKT